MAEESKAARRRRIISQLQKEEVARRESSDEDNPLPDMDETDADEPAVALQKARLGEGEYHSATTPTPLHYNEEEYDRYIKAMTGSGPQAARASFQTFKKKKK